MNLNEIEKSGEENKPITQYKPIKEGYAEVDHIHYYIAPKIKTDREYMLEVLSLKGKFHGHKEYNLNRKQINLINSALYYIEYMECMNG